MPHTSPVVQGQLRAGGGHGHFVPFTSIAVGEQHVNLNSQPMMPSTSREDFSDYVAHLQLHMALQARKLVPDFSSGGDSRAQLLQETQASIEKIVSRQF
jgi:hypothetical protein